jgi:hypothetical protein
VRREEVLLRVREERNILHRVKSRKANWIGRAMHKNCLIKHVIHGTIKERIEIRKDEKEDVSSYWMI